MVLPSPINATPDHITHNTPTPYPNCITHGKPTRECLDLFRKSTSRSVGAFTDELGITDNLVKLLLFGCKNIQASYSHISHFFNEEEMKEN